MNFLTAKLRVTLGSVKDKRKKKEVRALRFMAPNEGSVHRDLRSHSSGLSLERKMRGTLRFMNTHLAFSKLSSSKLSGQ